VQALKKVLKSYVKNLITTQFLMQLPIGAEENFAGVVDLITKRSDLL
jgi:translation elongation factor EF-G